MKITARTVTFAMIISILTSVESAALTTNYFITAGGELQTAANWSDGQLPLATNDYVGVLSNINAGSSSTPGGAYLGLNLILKGTSQTTGNGSTAQTIDKTIVVMDSAKLYNPSDFRVYGAVTIMNTSTQQTGKALTIYSGGLVDVYDSGSVQSSRACAIQSNATIRLNGGATLVVSPTSPAYFLTIAPGGRLDFTSTNAVFQQGRTNTTVALNGMIADGRITINGQQASTNHFDIAYVSGTGTTMRATTLIGQRIRLLMLH